LRYYNQQLFVLTDFFRHYLVVGRKETKTTRDIVHETFRISTSNIRNTEVDLSSKREPRRKKGKLSYESTGEVSERGKRVFSFLTDTLKALRETAAADNSPIQKNGSQNENNLTPGTASSNISRTISKEETDDAENELLLCTVIEIETSLCVCEHMLN